MSIFYNFQGLLLKFANFQGPVGSLQSAGTLRGSTEDGSIPNERQNKGHFSAGLPGDRVAVELEEPEQVLSLLPVPGLLLGRQGVVRDQQGVGAPAYRQGEQEDRLS